MRAKERYAPRFATPRDTLPFSCAAEAWFWFLQAQQAREDGARITAGSGIVSRPCEPVDIYRVVDRLYRQRRLVMDHLLVLRHYGRRLMPPDPRRAKEIRAHALWVEAMARIEDSLIAKGIVAKPVLPASAWFSTFSSSQTTEIFS